MLNPHSLANINLVPIVSVPAEALNHKIYFFSGRDFAEAIAEEGKSFHGVLHKMTAEDMIILDHIE
jgi:hypothetical protein